jgi:eukaryotic-like serine/threonine-protein kinase
MTEMAKGRNIIGKYRLERQLADGGMGAVWLGFDLKLRRRVVVKFLRVLGDDDPDMVARFEREARAAARVRSPHVIETYDYGIDAGRAFIILEYLEGEDLNARLTRESTLPPGHLAMIAKQLGKALDAIHAAGIVHRDLKPGNIFLMTAGGEDFVKVLDFGIAKAAAGTSGRITQSGIVLGTPKYMSPEQIKASTGVDYRTDLWAMAVILYRTITGRCPFVAGTPAELVAAISQCLFPKASEVAPGIPCALDGFFGRALARNPDARFQSGKELTDAFQAALHEPGPAFASPAYAARIVHDEPYQERETMPGVGSRDVTLSMGAAYYQLNEADMSPERAGARSLDAPASPSWLPQRVIGACQPPVWDREAETLNPHGEKGNGHGPVSREPPSSLLAPPESSRDVGRDQT